MTIALPRSEFKAYVAEVGPGRGRVARPAQCLFCDGERVWFNGWRRVLVMFGELDIEALPRGERTARLAELAARTYQTPGGRERRFSVRTL